MPVKGLFASDHTPLLLSMAAAGLGLAYVAEHSAAPWLRTGALLPVLEECAPTVPGLFLYFPNRARASRPLRAFIDMARDLLPLR